MWPSREMLNSPTGTRSTNHPVALLRAIALGPDLVVAQLAFDRKRQSRQLALQDEVVRAPLHRLDRHLLAHDSRDHDERQLASRRAHYRQRVEPVEPRHRVVRYHQVPTALCQRLPHCLRRIYPLIIQVAAAAPELQHRKLGIIRRVVDEQYPPRSDQVPFLESTGRSFSTSQYRHSCRTASTNCRKSTGLRT